MAGEATFIKSQYGKEVTRGTGVAATRQWPGTVKLPADRKPDHPIEKNGSRIQSRRTIIKQIQVDGINMTMEQGMFQALLMVFGIGLKGGVTGTPIVATDYVSDFTPSWTAANNPSSISLETGDNIQAFEVDWVMAKSIKISGKIGADEYVKVEVECFGKQTDPVTFTAGLLPENGEWMLANLTKVWIDSNWDSLGCTQKTSLLREYSVEIQTGNHPKFFAAGVKTMNGFGEGVPEMAITLTFEGDTEANGYFAGYQAATEYAMRLLIEGGPTSVGNANHSLQIDAFGAFDEIIPLASEDNGNNLTTGVFVATGDRGQLMQIDTATAAGACTGSGNMTCIVTAAGMAGSPKTLNVAVLNGDAVIVWAEKVRAALRLDAAVTAMFSVGGTGTAIKLIRNVYAANDATLNIALATGTATGITAAPSSANTQTSAISSANEKKFGVVVCTDRAAM
jgi:hypothetical protein